MYKKSLNKIITMVKISEALDQNGYVNESVQMLYNAFELAENTTLKMATEINNMTRTASKNKQRSKIEEMENMRLITAGFGQTLIDLGKRGLGLTGEKMGNWLSKLTQKTGDKVSKNVRNILNESGEEAATIYTKTGLLPKINNLFGESKNWVTKNPELAGGLGLGAVGLGTAGGIASLRNNPQLKQEVGAGTAGGIASPRNNPQLEQEVGAGTANSSVAMPQTSGLNLQPISVIENRINNLEQVVNAIRAKVGV